MSPRPRKPGSRDLPSNLYYESGRYRYRRPTDGKYFRMGTDRAAAINAARELNSIYTSDSGLVDRVIGRESDSITVAAFMPKFSQYLKERDLSTKTLSDYERQTKIILQHFAGDVVADLDVVAISSFLDSQKPTMSNRFRSLLSLFFRFAISKGLRSPGDNPAAATIPRKLKVERQRLTLIQWRAIYAKTPEALGRGRSDLFQRAIVLALHTLQRREDLAAFKLSSIEENAWKCEQIKTHARIRIQLSQEVMDVINFPRRVASRYVLHYPFEAGRRYRGKPVSPDWLTKSFQEVRDQCACFSSISPEARPSFHEIRGLGAELYRQAGWDERNIQRLLGHSTLAMTEEYLSRHDRPWEDASAGLNLAGNE